MPPTLQPAVSMMIARPWRYKKEGPTDPWELRISLGGVVRCWPAQIWAPPWPPPPWPPATLSASFSLLCPLTRAHPTPCLQGEAPRPVCPHRAIYKDASQ